MGMFNHQRSSSIQNLEPLDRKVHLILKGLDLCTLHLIKNLKSLQVFVVFKPLYDLQTNPVLLSQPQGEISS